jgi:hypothetical protein
MCHVGYANAFLVFVRSDSRATATFVFLVSVTEKQHDKVEGDGSSRGRAYEGGDRRIVSC